MELYYGIICMKSIPGIPGEPPERHLGPQGSPQARPWDPPGTPLGTRGTPLGRPGTPLGPWGRP